MTYNKTRGALGAIPLVLENRDGSVPCICSVERNPVRKAKKGFHFQWERGLAGRSYWPYLPNKSRILALSPHRSLTPRPKQGQVCAKVPHRVVGAQPITTAIFHLDYEVAS